MQTASPTQRCRGGAQTKEMRRGSPYLFSDGLQAQLSRQHFLPAFQNGPVWHRVDGLDVRLCYGRASLSSPPMLQRLPFTIRERSFHPQVRNLPPHIIGRVRPTDKPIDLLEVNFICGVEDTSDGPLEILRTFNRFVTFFNINRAYIRQGLPIHSVDAWRPPCWRQ